MANNKTVLKIINTFIGLKDDNVNMALPRCGTVGCIAGWLYDTNTTLEEKKERERQTRFHLGFDWDTMREYAIDSLDINNQTAISLFTPRGYSESYDRRPDVRTRAIAELTHLFNTGRVRYDWLDREIPYQQEKLNPDRLKEACDVESEKAA